MTRSEPPPENLEICFNLWVVVEERTKLAFTYMGKSYALRGTREEKSRILHTLATDDHHTVAQRALPERLRLLVDGEEIQGVATMAGVRDPNSGFWSELLGALEKELPPQVRFIGDRSISTRLPVDNPLCLMTVLLESEHGVLALQVQSTFLELS